METTESAGHPEDQQGGYRQPGVIVCMSGQKRHRMNPTAHNTVQYDRASKYLIGTTFYSTHFL
jgi:hypothetical protein